MTRQASLFDTPAPLPPTPAPAPAATPSAGRPSGWRKPDLPREHVCAVCQGAAIFGDGPTWYCFSDVPPGFLPSTRGAR